jgi:hypothetical protein
MPCKVQSGQRPSFNHTSQHRLICAALILRLPRPQRVADPPPRRAALTLSCALCRARSFAVAAQLKGSPALAPQRSLRRIHRAQLRRQRVVLLAEIATLSVCRAPDAQLCERRRLSHAAQRLRHVARSAQLCEQRVILSQCHHQRALRVVIAEQLNIRDYIRQRVALANGHAERRVMVRMHKVDVKVVVGRHVVCVDAEPAGWNAEAALEFRAALGDEVAEEGEVRGAEVAQAAHVAAAHDGEAVERLDLQACGRWAAQRAAPSFAGLACSQPRQGSGVRPRHSQRAAVQRAVLSDGPISRCE